MTLSANPSTQVASTFSVTIQSICTVTGFSTQAIADYYLQANSVTPVTITTLTWTPIEQLCISKAMSYSLAISPTMVAADGSVVIDSSK
jgi:hypothetical protein